LQTQLLVKDATVFPRENPSFTSQRFVVGFTCFALDRRIDSSERSHARTACKNRFPEIP
jgi:hypothetical protein